MRTEPTSVARCSVWPSLVWSVPERSEDARGPGSAGRAGSRGLGSIAVAPKPRLGQRAPETASEKAMRERAVNRPLVVSRFVTVLIYGRRLVSNHTTAY